MNRRGCVAVVCVAVCGVVAGLSVARPDEGKPAGGMPSKEEIARMQAEMMEQMAPTKEHEMLAKFAGEWNTRLTFAGEPGGQKVTSEGKMTAKMILGGRFLEMRSTGEVMGMQVETLTIMGFDRRFGKYTLVGYDTMGTYYIEAQGDYDEKTRTMVLAGTNYEAAMKADIKFRFTNITVSDDERRQTLVFDIPGVGESTIMEGVYTRIK